MRETNARTKGVAGFDRNGESLSCRLTAISGQIHVGLSGKYLALCCFTYSLSFPFVSPIICPGLSDNLRPPSCLCATGMSGLVELALAPDPLPSSFNFVLVLPLIFCKVTGDGFQYHPPLTYLSCTCSESKVRSLFCILFSIIDNLDVAICALT